MNPILQKYIGLPALVLVIFCSQLCYAQLPSTEQTAMADLKAGITPTPWNTGEPNPCLWDGVKCANDGTFDHITTLYLNFSTAYTINVASTIGDLPRLTSIKFFSATFTSPIPSTLSQTLLNGLEFQNCVGVTFPTTGLFYNMVNSVISATNSSLTNLPPADVFPNLSGLVINGGTLDTTIPSNYGTLTSLTSLMISHTTLGGTIPPELGSLQCQVFQLDNNRLVGSIPPQLGNLASPYITTLDLSNNLLNGSIPSELGNLQYIQTINLDNNQLTGAIPYTLFKPSLVSLSLNNNKLSGRFPSDTTQATKLTTLLLANNSFPEGPIPYSFYLIPSLVTFDGSGNQFTGSIPTFAGPITTLKLANNKLTGSIPQFTQAPLVALDLSNNNLTGIFPGFLLNMPGMEELIMARNSIAGCAPIDRFPSLTSCSLAGNVMCCTNATLVCDAALNQCLDCGTSKPADNAVCSYNENGVPIWIVNGDVIISNNSNPIENTVINGSVITTIDVTLSNVIIYGNLSVSGAQVTVNNGIIDVRGCAFVNGSLVLNLTPEESEQLANNGTLERSVLMYDSACSNVDFDQIVVNGEAACSEAMGQSQKAPGLITVLITSRQLSCNVQEPINDDGSIAGPTSSPLPEWAIPVIVVVGSVLVAGAITTGVLVSRHLAQKKADNDLSQMLNQK